MNIILGIDIGTTSVKVNCTKFNGDGDYQIIKRATLAYKNHIESQYFDRLNNGKFDKSQLIKIGEINPYIILSALIYCIEEFDVSLRHQVNAIGITGQMHGVLFWNKKCLYKIRSINSNELNFELNFDENYENLLSNIITWEDCRCSKEFLDDLPDNVNSKRKAHSGYGVATLYWFLKNKPNYLDNYSYMGSIMDLIIHLLCTDLEHPVTSIQLANSYGYFDLSTNTWSTNLDENFPKNFLPIVVNDGHVVGKLNYQSIAIKSGTPVYVACGDLQCAIYSTMVKKTSTAILNSGTSIQLAFPISDNQKNDKISFSDLVKLFEDKLDFKNNLLSESNDLFSNICLDIVPYFDNKYLATCSVLNGGNVIAFFIKSIGKFVTDLVDVKLEENEIWSKISQLAKNYMSEKKKLIQSNENELKIEPRLFGERHELIKSKFSINSISTTNFELGKIYYSLCSSIIDNVFTMCPIELLKQLNIEKICSVGSLLQKNEILKECLQSKLIEHKVDLIFEDEVEADIGISMVTIKYFSKLNKTN